MEICNFVIDIIKTKIYKPKQTERKRQPKHICTLHFNNKALEAIRLPQIFNHSHVVSFLSLNTQTKEKVPTVIYKIRQKILKKMINYNETVISRNVNGEIAFSPNTGQCDCTSSTFYDPHYKHIITIDLKIMKKK